MVSGSVKDRTVNKTDFVDSSVDSSETELSTDAFVRRMEILAKEVGSVNSLAKLAGISQGGIRSYFRGGEPSRKILIALAKAAGVSPVWLATGEGPMHPGDEAEFLPTGDLVPVPHHSLSPSAGHGAFCDSDQMVMVMIPKVIVDQTGVPLKDLCMVTASGSSMEPEIRDGDILFADRGDRGRQKADGTFILRLNDALMVKNVQILPDGSIEVSSTNKAFRPIAITHKNPPRDFALLARVVSGLRRF